MKLLDKSKLIKNHEITALDNLEMFCKNIEKNNGKYNAFLEINKNSALECAERYRFPYKIRRKSWKTCRDGYRR